MYELVRLRPYETLIKEDGFDNFLSRIVIWLDSDSASADGDLINSDIRRNGEFIFHGSELFRFFEASGVI